MPPPSTAAAALSSPTRLTWPRGANGRAARVRRMLLKLRNCSCEAHQHQQLLAPHGELCDGGKRASSALRPLLRPNWPQSLPRRKTFRGGAGFKAVRVNGRVKHCLSDCPVPVELARTDRRGPHRRLPPCCLLLVTGGVLRSRFYTREERAGVFLKFPPSPAMWEPILRAQRIAWLGATVYAPFQPNLALVLPPVMLAPSDTNAGVPTGNRVSVHAEGAVMRMVHTWCELQAAQRCCVAPGARVG
jgi:hypothetical protein